MMTPIEVTEVKITPVQDSKKRLLAWVNLTLNNCLGVRSCRIIQGKDRVGEDGVTLEHKGRMFLSFPQEPGTVRCAKCGFKPRTTNGWHKEPEGFGDDVLPPPDGDCCCNPITARFCMHCGHTLPNVAPNWHELVIPYGAEVRQAIEDAVFKEYERVMSEKGAIS